MKKTNIILSFVIYNYYTDVPILAKLFIQE